MVDKDVIIAKAAAVNKHVNRIVAKIGSDIETFKKDIDCQDVVLFNIQMAVQNCIDIAAHIISATFFIFYNFPLLFNRPF